MSIACVCGHGIPCRMHPDIPAYTMTVPYADPSVPPEVLEAEWDAGMQQTQAQCAARAENPSGSRDATDETAARAILDEQARGTPLPEAADRVFAMTPSELGQTAVEGTRKWRGRPGPYTPRGCF